MNSTTHSVPVNVYLVDVVLPFGASGLLMAGVEVMEWPTGGAGPFQILVGRDIICQGLFVLSTDGHFTLCI